MQPALLSRQACLYDHQRPWRSSLGFHCFLRPGFYFTWSQPMFAPSSQPAKCGGLQFSQEGRNPTKSTVGEANCEDLSDLVCGEALSSSSGSQKTVCGSHFSPSSIDPFRDQTQAIRFGRETLPHEPSYQPRICLGWQLKAFQCHV